MGSIRSIYGLFVACSPGCKICINTRYFFPIMLVYHSGSERKVQSLLRRVQKKGLNKVTEETENICKLGEKHLRNKKQTCFRGGKG